METCVGIAIEADNEVSNCLEKCGGKVVVSDVEKNYEADEGDDDRDRTDYNNSDADSRKARSLEEDEEDNDTFIQIVFSSLHF